MMPLAEALVPSLKLVVTLLIAPAPLTLVALTNAMPWLLFRPSSKPDAPVTVVVLLAALTANNAKEAIRLAKHRSGRG